MNLQQSYYGSEEGMKFMPFRGLSEMRIKQTSDLARSLSAFAQTSGKGGRKVSLANEVSFTPLHGRITVIKGHPLVFSFCQKRYGATGSMVLQAALCGIKLWRCIFPEVPRFDWFLRDMLIFCAMKFYLRFMRFP